MNKNLGKIFFSVTFIGFIFIGISLFNIDKNKGQIEDLYGDRSALGNMSILLQSKKRFYETDEIKINKDDLSIDTMAKQGLYNFNLTNTNIEGREILEEMSNTTIDYTNSILEDEDKIASVYVMNEITKDYEYELVANIKIKDKNSNKIESYEIPMDNSYNESTGIYASVPISKDKDNIYIVTLHSTYNELDDDSEINDDQYINTYLNLYKVNLTSEKSKHILTKEYDGKDIHLTGNLCFSNNDKSYFLIRKKDDSSRKYKTSLLEFNVINKEMNIIDLGTMNDYIGKYYVQDDKVLITSAFGSEENSNKQSRYGGVRAILVNLENKKVEYINNIKLDSDFHSILQVRRDDDKIYVTTVEYDDSENISQNDSYCIYVFDENDNELLYKGKINQNTSYRVQVGIVREDEL